MRLRGDEIVSSLAPVLESEASDPTAGVPDIDADVIPAPPEAVQQALSASSAYPVEDEDSDDEIVQLDPDDDE
jgi:hypothetical protein